MGYQPEPAEGKETAEVTSGGESLEALESLVGEWSLVSGAARVSKMRFEDGVRKLWREEPDVPWTDELPPAERSEEA